MFSLNDSDQRIKGKIYYWVLMHFAMRNQLKKITHLLAI